MNLAFVIYFILQLLMARVEAQCSNFQFVLEPPTELPCNPFDTKPLTPVWCLKTVCKAIKLNGSQLFDVHWLHRKTNGEVEDLGRPDMWTSSDHDEEVYFGAHWTNDPYNNKMLGEYWCQIIVTSEQHNHYLDMSNVFTIEQPESYTTPQCSDIIQVSNDILCSSQKTITPVFTTTTIDTSIYNIPSITTETVQQSTTSKCNTDDIFTSSELTFNTTSITITSSQSSYSPTSIIASSISSKQNNETSSELVFTTITSSQSSYSPTSIIASSISSTQNIDETLASYKLSFNLSTVSNFTKTRFTTSHNITESNNNAKSELGIIIGAIILIMMSIILLSAIILVVMIAVKRMKTKSQVVSPLSQTRNEDTNMSQTRDENTNMSQTRDENINAIEPYYIAINTSSPTSNIAQGPDNPQYQPLSATNYVSVYEYVSQSSIQHNYAAINPADLMENTIYTSLQRMKTDSKVSPPLSQTRDENTNTKQSTK